MIYTLTQELEDLLAVTYVMNAMLYILEQEDGIQETIKEAIEEKKTKVVPSEMESVVSAVSSTESVSPQDPTGSRTVLPEQSREVPNTSKSLESQNQPEVAAGCPAIQIEGRKEALHVTINTGNRILAKLQEENESLSEQVEVLDKMNERLARKVKDLEKTMRNFDETAEDIAEKDRQLERYKQEDEIKNKTLADLLGKMAELQKELVLNNSSLSETTDQLKDVMKTLAFEQKKSQFLETEIKNYLTDQPSIENFEVLKSYLHPEMEKYAVEAVQDAIGSRELRGDAATAFVSKYFDELYGTHWQAVLFRTDGHGALVQHNNNCFIRLRLGNFEMILFRY